MTYVRPTKRQRELLAALVETGSIAAAAAKLGITHHAANVYLDRMRRRTGLTNAQAVYFGAVDGWLFVRERSRNTTGIASRA